jgi:hypothetical protein
MVRGVDILVARNKNDIRPGAFQQGKVAVEVPGIGLEVLVWGELRGIDEDADHGYIVFIFGLPDKLEMPLVKVAHGGHEAHGTPAFTAQVFHFLDGMGCLHALKLKGP